MPFYVFSYLLRNLYRMLVWTKPGQHIKQTMPSVVLPNQSLRYSRFFSNLTKPGSTEHGCAESTVEAFDPDSTSNAYGRYGFPFSPDSIKNPYGAGSPYSPSSPANPYGRGLRIEGR